jgi:hypothetical protein
LGFGFISDLRNHVTSCLDFVKIGFMRTVLFAITSIAIVLIVAASPAEPANEAKRAAKSSADSSKKEPVHLVVKSGAQLKEIFTYFPYPQIPTEYKFANISGIGVYRLTINPQGAVTEIKILKRMGPIMDAVALTTFIRWRAKPGPDRNVDTPWTITPGYQAIRRSRGSHIPDR